jgi:ABC-type bacteriocin/lantibiotic exporter with double-glycine peptidase domain
VPDAKAQRNIALLAMGGVLASCFGCGLLWQNQIMAAVVVLILAELVLVPVFVILLRTRRRLKKVVAQQDREKQEQLDALAGVGTLTETKVEGIKTEEEPERG